MHRIDGKALADSIIKEARALSDRVAERTGRRTKMVVIQVGNDPASTVYVNRKEAACRRAGILCETIRKNEGISSMALTIMIDRFNNDPNVDGIMMQLPLPEHLRESTQFILDHIKPWKDVDGLTSFNQGALQNNRKGLRPCTPLGIMRMLEHEKVNLSGKRVCILGRSSLVGKPLAAMMTNADATVTLCHSKTSYSERAEALKESFIIVGAMGRAEAIKADSIGFGQVLIDVGINRTDDGRIVGDFDSRCYEDCGMYTPVPGGVGPMTVAMLIMNTLEAREMGE